MLTTTMMLMKPPFNERGNACMYGVVQRLDLGELFCVDSLAKLVMFSFISYAIMLGIV